MYRSHNNHRDRDNHGAGEKSSRAHDRGYVSSGGELASSEIRRNKQDKEDQNVRHTPKSVKQLHNSFSSPHNNNGSRHSHPHSVRSDSSSHHHRSHQQQHNTHHHHNRVEAINKHQHHAPSHQHHHSNHQEQRPHQHQHQQQSQPVQASPQSKATYYAGPKFLTPPIPSILPMPPKSWLKKT